MDNWEKDIIIFPGATFRAWHHRQLRSKRALTPLNNVPLRARRLLSLYKFYGDSAFLVHNGTSLNSVNTLLALSRLHAVQSISKNVYFWSIFFFFFFLHLSKQLCSARLVGVGIGWWDPSSRFSKQWFLFVCLFSRLLLVNPFLDPYMYVGVSLLFFLLEGVDATWPNSFCHFWQDQKVLFW